MNGRMIIRKLLLWVLGTNFFVRLGVGNTIEDPPTTDTKEPVKLCLPSLHGAILDGDVTCSDKNRPGSECQVKCDGGHFVEGITNNRCLNNGSWSNPLPKECEETMLSKLRCFGFGLGLPIVFIFCLAMIGVIVFGQRDCREERKRRKALKTLDATQSELKEIIPLKS